MRPLDAFPMEVRRLVKGVLTDIDGTLTAGGRLTAPMPGKVIDLRVQLGDRVEAGQTVLVLEAMKMEHPMLAHEDGVVSEVRVALGDQVESGALLLVVEPDGEANEPE